MEITLKEIKNELKDLLPQFVLETKVVNQNGTNFLQLKRLTGIRKIIDRLDRLNISPALTSQLKASVLFTTSSDELNLQQVEGNKLVHILDILKEISATLQEVLFKTIPEENIDSINIKLPPNVTDFNALSKVAADIHIALSQVLFLPEINGEEKIVSVENGSIWFNVFIGVGCISVVAGLVWSSAVVAKKIIEARLMAEQLQTMKIKNDSLKDIQRAQKEEIDMALDAEARFIYSEHFKENEPENIERIKNSIKILSELVNKGAEIHPALVAPEKVSNLFPNYKNLLGLESKIKKLSSAEDNAA